MVYQQFINYPNLTVFENIASPLRVAGVRRAEIDAPGRASIAELLQPDADARPPPAELSGGQQQRTALARAWSRTPTSCCSTSRSPISTTSCARSCATSCRSSSPAARCTVVYATSEPTEALLLGGHTATAARGPHHAVRADRARSTASPVDLTTARVFSDPPINTAPVVKQGDEIVLRERRALARRRRLRRAPRRPLHARPPAAPRRARAATAHGAAPLEGKVLITELSRLGERRSTSTLGGADLGVAVARRARLSRSARPRGFYLDVGAVPATSTPTEPIAP